MYSVLGIIFFIAALLSSDSSNELVGLMIVSALFFIASGISSLVVTIRSVIEVTDEDDED